MKRETVWMFSNLPANKIFVCVQTFFPVFFVSVYSKTFDDDELALELCSHGFGWTYDQLPIAHTREKKNAILWI